MSKDKKPKTKLDMSVIAKKIILWMFLISAVVLVIIGIVSRNFDIRRKTWKQIQDAQQVLNNEDSKQGESKKIIPILTVPGSPYSYKISSPPPEISAKAYIVTDLKSGKNIYGKNEAMQLPPASVTKIMTAIIALEDYDLASKVTVPARCVGINGSNVGYKTGEVLTLEDLLYGLLVTSGADSACTIANISGEADFIIKMNAKAKDIGMVNTKFQNEIGFDAQNQHLTTVEDLEKLSKYALKFSSFRKIVGTKMVDIKSLNTKNVYHLANTNDLLFSIPGTVGIKTGSTDEAKECLAYLYENQGNEILIIILGSQDRFKDTASILRWAITEVTATDMPKTFNQTIMPDAVRPQ